MGVSMPHGDDGVQRSGFIWGRECRRIDLASLINRSRQ